MKHTEGNEIFKIRKCILVPKQILFHLSLQFAATQETQIKKVGFDVLYPLTLAISMAAIIPGYYDVWT